MIPLRSVVRVDGNDITVVKSAFQQTHTLDKTLVSLPLESVFSEVCEEAVFRLISGDVLQYFFVFLFLCSMFSSSKESECHSLFLFRSLLSVKMSK